MKFHFTSRKFRRAFSLLEVMIAIVAFATASLAILSLVSRSIDNARRLQKPMVDATELAAIFSQTNSIVEGTDSGELTDMMGDAYKGYSWEWIITEVQTNRLYEVDFHVFGAGSGSDRPLISSCTNLFYRPASPAGSLDGATVAR